MKFPSLPVRRPIIRELLIFLGFLALTAIMTWPWVLHLRNAVADTGDPYAISYFLWWDFHQTFHDPLHLFQATVFYPYHDTLAFGEFDYGVSLLFFPLFVIGLRPLTVYGIATFLSFPFTAYGTFRLARTLSASTAIAWIAGIIIAFLPFRFHHLSHLHLIFAGWIPLLFEALVLFARKRTWPRAAWLGFAFLMNGLTCTTWLILTVIPLGISAALLLTRNNAWRDGQFWLRAAATLCLASLLLLPFLLPLRRVAAVNGFIRSPDEVRHYSARFINWLAAEERNKVWRALGTAGVDTEMVLFPGLLAPLLALAAFLLPPRQTKERVEEKDVGYKRIVLGLLDSTAIISGIVALLTLGYDVFKLRLFGHVILSATGPARAVNALIVTLLVRCLIAYPRVLRRCMGGDKNLSASFNSRERSELFGHALVWIAIGFAGSFGLNFFFHKFLYYYVYIFRGMRVATRWAMICYVGLALLAGLGAQRFTDAVGRWRSRFGKAAVYGVIVVAILFELHAAPLAMIRGEINPDALTLDLKNRRMSGGIIELPIGDRDHVYMLRAADHGHPIVNGKYSFVPPLQNEIEQLTSSRPIPDRVLDIFENIPVSYVTVHRAFLSADDQEAIQRFLDRGVAAGRVRFIRSYNAADLYAVTKTEPNAKSEGAPPFPIQPTTGSLIPEKDNNLGSPDKSFNPIDDARFFARTQYLDFLEREPDREGWNYWTEQIQRCGNAVRCVEDQRVKVSAAFFVEPEFQETGFFIYRLYKATLGRPPRYEEFRADRAQLIGGPNLGASKSALVESWLSRPVFIRLYSSNAPPAQFVDLLLKTMRNASGVDLEPKRRSLIDELGRTGSRVSVVRRVVEDDAFSGAEYDRAFVLMQYFGYLKRDPDPSGYAFWVNALSKQNPNNYSGMVRAFITSKEYRSRFVGH